MAEDEIKHYDTQRTGDEGVSDRHVPDSRDQSSRCG
jgi:hypothetical protein